MAYLVAFILAITPLYILRFNVFNIPTTFLEISIYAVFLVGAVKAVRCWYYSRKNDDIKKTESKKILPTVFIAGLLFFFLAGFFSVFVSEEIKTGLGAFKAWFVDGLLVFLLVIFFIRTKNDFAKIIYGLSIGAFLVSIIGLWQFFTGDVLPDGRIASLYIYDNVLIPSGGLSNFIAMYLTPIILLQIIFFLNIANDKSIVITAKSGLPAGKQGIQRVLFIVLVIIELFTLYLSQSLGGFLGLVAGLSVIVFYKLNWKEQVLKNIRTIVVFAALAFLLVVPQLNNPKLKNLLNFSGNGSSSARLQIWQASWLMIKDNSIDGIGLNNFEKVYREYVPKVVFPPLEWMAPHSHNLYLSLWLETGIVGLASFLVLMTAAIYGLAKENTVFSIAILAALVSILIHGFVDTPILKNDLAVVFWILAGLSFKD